MKGEMIVLLDNCLRDVPRSGRRLDKGCKQVRPSSISPGGQILPRNLHVKNIQSDTLMNYQNEIVPAEQKLNLKESLLLPIPNAADNNEVEKTNTAADDPLLCWEELGEPFIDVVNTPESSKSSMLDLDLTPPSSVTSKRSLFEADTSFENSFILDFDVQPGKTAKANVDKKVSTDSCIYSNKLCVEIAYLEPTLHQLQVLNRRNKASGTVTPNNNRKHSLRPPDRLKQFVPFMFEQAEYGKKQRKKPQSYNVFHSTPMPSNSDSVNMKRSSNYAKVERGFCIKGQFKKKKVKSALRRKAVNARQLKLALKEKLAFQKKQLKLALQQKKEATKHRNKFENALDSINMRMCNQNSFWRMLP